jgi:hypothetical protein
MYHFKEHLSFPPNIKTDSELLCGQEQNIETKVTNFIGLVDCPKCLSIISKTRCSICGCMLNPFSIDKNQFYLSCGLHKEEVQFKTEKFFKENPDYTKWQRASV